MIYAGRVAFSLVATNISHAYSDDNRRQPDYFYPHISLTLDLLGQFNDVAGSMHEHFRP